jgi:hypothetical protein
MWIEIFEKFDFMELLILFFSGLLGLTVIVLLIGKLVSTVTKALHDLNIKRLGLHGAEFYDDPVTGERKPSRRTTPRLKKPVSRK